MAVAAGRVTGRPEPLLSGPAARVMMDRQESLKGRNMLLQGETREVCLGALFSPITGPKGKASYLIF